MTKEILFEILEAHPQLMRRYARVCKKYKRCLDANEGYYLLAVGDIPPGATVVNACGDDRCMSPDHFKLVYPANN